MLVLAPLLISYKTEDMLAKREMLSDVQTFIDKVKDTYTITETDLNKLYLDCNSHGMAVNVTVRRLIESAVFDEVTGTTSTSYFAVSDIDSLMNINSGDLIQVTVEELAITSARRLTFALLKIDEGKFSFTLAGVVG